MLDICTYGLKARGRWRAILDIAAELQCRDRRIVRGVLQRVAGVVPHAQVALIGSERYIRAAYIISPLVGTAVAAPK